MKKIRNDKMDGRFYSDEYVGDLNKRIYDLREENKQLKERIEKAIEFIKENAAFCDDWDKRYYWLEIEEYIDLLSILQDKEQ